MLPLKSDGRTPLFNLSQPHGVVHLRGPLARTVAGRSAMVDIQPSETSLEAGVVHVQIPSLRLLWRQSWLLRLVSIDHHR
jgi:hypothetical protein